jgi:hypothetical protein
MLELELELKSAGNCCCCKCKPTKTHLVALCCSYNILTCLSSNRQMFNLCLWFIKFIVLFLSESAGAGAGKC